MSKLNMATPHVFMARETERTPRMFITKPVFTMSLTMRCPDAKAMELGGVDTGSMKAYEHPIVAGIMKYKGFTEA